MDNRNKVRLFKPHENAEHTSSLMEIELSKLLLFTLLLFNEQTEIRQPEVRYAYRNLELYFETTKIETGKMRKEF